MGVRLVRRGAVVAAIAIVFLTSALPARALAPDPGGNAADLRTAAQLGKQFGFSSGLGGWNSGVPATREADLIKWAGGNVHRFTINWAALQPLPTGIKLPPLTAASSYLPDREYLAALERGITPIIVVLDAPNWASGYPISCHWLDLYCQSQLRAIKPHQPPTIGAIPHYANFMRGIAMRYPQAIVETWNEPNEGYYWASRPPDPAHMAKMQCAAYDAIKSVNPTQKVLAPGIGVAITNSPTKMTYLDYSRVMYQTMGNRICWDLLGVHMYFGIYFDGADTVLAKMTEALRASRAERGDHTPVWVTETGVTTSGSGIMGWQQADMHIRGMHKLLTMPDISAVVIHALRDGGTMASYNNTWHVEYGMGILTQGQGAKPGYCHWVRLNGNSYPGC